MRRIILTCLMQAVFVGLFAQEQTENNSTENDKEKPSDDRKSHLVFDTYYELGSSRISSDFLSKIYQGQFLDDETKLWSSQDNSTSDYRIGGVFASTITYSYPINKLIFGKKASLGFQVGHMSMGGLRFTKNAYDLIFYGNKEYLGETADFSGSSLNFMQYQSIGAHMTLELNDEDDLYFGLSFLKGQNFVEANFERATLFTSADAEKIDIDVKATILQSDTSSGNEISAFNGLGGAAFIRYTKILNQNIAFHASASNLGVISWNSKSIINTADTAFTFEGIEVDNILNLQDSVFESNSIDELSDGLLSKEGKSSTRLLPFSVSTGISKYGVKNNLTANIIYIYLPGYIPKVELSYGRNMLDQQITISPIVTYGGFTKLTYGLSIDFNFQPVFVRLSSNAIGGFIFKDEPAAQNVLLMAAVNF